MDKGLLERVVQSGEPFTIITAAGDRYEVPHQDFVHFSPKKTTIFVFWETEDGDETFAMIPLLTITSVEAKQPVEN